MNTMRPSLPPTLPPPVTLVSLAEYVQRVLDDTQRATRALVTVPAMPPSGRGDDRTTVPAPKAA